MKLFLISSKHFYSQIPRIATLLETAGHTLVMPNCFDKPNTESEYRSKGIEQHSKWKGEMLRHSSKVIEDIDAVLVLNFEKNGIPNYIGGATFLEMYDAFRLGKKIFIYNEIPEGMLHDEIIGFSPVVLSGDLTKIK